MKPTLPLVLAAAAIGMGTTASAQRYLQEVFSNANVTITPDVTYGTNIDFLTSNFGSPLVPTDIGTLQTIASTTGVYPAAYYNPSDVSTAVKITDVKMDVYQPDQAVDPLDTRPVVIYVHTGNALPPPLNGSPTGTRKDSSAVENCKRFARRGYVAISMSYRLGWNPLAATEQERRGSLLNAVYRAVHDVRQCVRNLKANAGLYNVDVNRIVVFGEGTGGYISLANATLDEGAELFIEKFRPDPFDPTVSYVDTNQVGNLDGFNGQLALYRPNGQTSTSHFCVNTGGALADTSWMAQGDVPMVAFHTVFDPFAPFTEGIVIVPTTGGPVVPVQGSNLFMDLVNEFGNNSSFASLPSTDPFTIKARALYNTTVTHGTANVLIHDGEGLFPFVRPAWPAPAMEEASPWQWWDPNSAIAMTVVSAGPPPITAHIAASASNPDMSATKGRTYLDTIHGYLNPRIVCALQLGLCSLVGIDEENTAVTVDVYPNPATDNVTVLSGQGIVRSYRLLDVNGRQVAANTVNMHRFAIERNGIAAGSYFLELDMEFGKLTRKVMLD